MNEFMPTNAKQFADQLKETERVKAESIAQHVKQMKLNEKQAQELEKQTEQMQEQNYIISSLKKITEQNIKSSKEYNDASKRTAKVSLLLSIIAITISIGFGIVGSKSSSNWQKEQIRELKSQNLLLKQLNENLTKTK